MKRPRLARYGNGPVIALVAAVGAGIAGVASVWRAIEVESVNAAEVAQMDLAAALLPRPDSLLTTDVATTLDLDPFHPERRRPARRFRLPGERGPRAVRRPGLPEGVQLTGTIVYQSGGGAALLQRPGFATLMIRVGERIEGLTLDRVDREQAVFKTTTGVEVVIRVPRAGG